MNKLLPLLLVAAFILIPDLSFAYDRDSYESYIPRSGGGSGNSGIFGTIFGFVFIIIISYLFLSGLYKQAKEDATPIIASVIFGFILVQYFHKVVEFVEKVFGPFSVVVVIFLIFYIFKLFIEIWDDTPKSTTSSTFPLSDKRNLVSPNNKQISGNTRPPSEIFTNIKYFFGIVAVFIGAFITLYVIGSIISYYSS